MCSYVAWLGSALSASNNEHVAKGEESDSDGMEWMTLVALILLILVIVMAPILACIGIHWAKEKRKKKLLESIEIPDLVSRPKPTLLGTWCPSRASYAAAEQRNARVVCAAATASYQHLARVQISSTTRISPISRAARSL